MSAMPTPQVQIEVVTPEMATEYLAMSVGNRPIREPRVMQYAQAMLDGQWMLTGEPLIFNGSALVNGHHRLMACHRAGVSFTTVIVRGVDEAAYEVIDSGLPRSNGDVLGHLKVPNANQAAATARIVLMFRSGAMSTPNWAQVITSRIKVVEEVTSNAARYERAIRTWGNERARQAGLNRTAVSAFALIIDDESRLNAFFDPIFTGAGLEMLDPRLAMRNWAMQSKSREARLHLSALIRAWNAWTTNRPLKQIKPWVHGQPFPIIGDESV